MSGFRAIAFEGRRAGDVLRDMERALLDLGTRALVLKPLEEMLGRVTSGVIGGGGGGLFSGGGLGGLFGLGGSAVEAAGVGAAKLSAEAAMQAGTLVSFFHRGGLVGQDAVPQRVVPLTLFHGAPRFHQGGGFLTRTEFPAILEIGERVLTRRQQAAVGAAVADRPRPVIQNVTIQTPDAGSFRQSRGQVLAELSRSIARGARNR